MNDEQTFDDLLFFEGLSLETDDLVSHSLFSLLIREERVVDVRVGEEEPWFLPFWFLNLIESLGIVGLVVRERARWRCCVKRSGTESSPSDSVSSAGCCVVVSSGFVDVSAGGGSTAEEEEEEEEEDEEEESGGSSREDEDEDEEEDDKETRGS